MKETLIFCFDGTCNDPEDAGNSEEDESITNILKLHILFGGDLNNEAKIQIDDDSQQRSFYYSGVGTYGGPLKRIFNMAFAPENADVGRILNAAIDDLRDHHHEDCRVLVFGFSRGAALARRFAAVAKKKTGIKNLKIDFLGVFDTVASISGTDFSPETKPASDVVFENGIMSQEVLKAVHLVALDENRVTFQPTLFDHETNSDRITEVWFPGVHSDVGGGYWNDGLSDLALEYMVKKIRQECVGYVRTINPGEVDYVQLNDKDGTQITNEHITRKALVNGKLHEHRPIIFRRTRLHARKARIAEGPPEVYPRIHTSVRLRFKEVSGYRPRALSGVQYVVTGTCRRLSKAEQKASGRKYVVTTDDNQVGGVREGALGLGDE